MVTENTTQFNCSNSITSFSSSFVLSMFNCELFQLIITKLPSLFSSSVSPIFFSKFLSLKLSQYFHLSSLSLLYYQYSYHSRISITQWLIVSMLEHNTIFVSFILKALFQIFFLQQQQKFKIKNISKISMLIILESVFYMIIGTSYRDQFPLHLV